MSEECLFCKIIKGEVPSSKVFENDMVIAFKDIQPVAKEHLLFIHKEHDKNLNEMMTIAPHRSQEVLQGIHQYTSSSGLNESGFRVITNIGRDGGQVIFHTHFHVLGREKLGPLNTKR